MSKFLPGGNLVFVDKHDHIASHANISASQVRNESLKRPTADCCQPTYESSDWRGAD